MELANVDTPPKDGQAPFKAWLLETGVIWLVELHPQFIGHPEWNDVPHRHFLNNHIAVYCRSEAELERLMSPLQAPVTR